MSFLLNTLIRLAIIMKPSSPKPKAEEAIVPVGEAEAFANYTITELMNLKPFVDSSPEAKGVWIHLYSFCITQLPFYALHPSIKFGTIPYGVNWMGNDWQRLVSPHIGLKQIRSNSNLWNFFGLTPDGRLKDIVIWGTPAWGSMIDFWEKNPQPVQNLTFGEDDDDLNSHAI